MDNKRDPHSDHDLVTDDAPTPSQGGSSGGDMQRELGSLDEEMTATGADPLPSSLLMGEKPRGS